MRIASIVSAALLAAILSTVPAATAPASPVSLQVLFAPPTGPQAIPSNFDRATTHGGTLTLRWNTDLLHDLKIEQISMIGARSKDGYGAIGFDLDKNSHFEVDVQGQGVRGLAGGTAAFSGGYQLRIGNQRTEWRDISMLVRPGAEPRIDLAGPDGTVLFYVDRVMYTLADDGRSFEIRSADVRIAPTLAERLGLTYAADLAVAELKLWAPIESRIVAKSALVCHPPNWPGLAVPTPPIDTYQADVFLSDFSGQASRCGLCDVNDLNCTSGGCDGPGVADGRVVFTPSSTLINNRNSNNSLVSVVGDPLGTSTSNFAADVPWHQKFSGNYPPYDNDQHPFLIWNLYRLDADGTITQVGRSGVKHAFLTTNVNPSNPPDTCDGCNGNNVLGRACSDTYGTSNNDYNADLGPRREILPAVGKWGRCGSVFDDIDNITMLPGCDGEEDSTDPSLFSRRMLVHESDLLPNGGPSATFLFESWYIVREDINIYNTMATRPFSPVWNGSSWIATNGSPFQLGPAIDRWVPAGTSTATQRNSELSNVEGHAKVAVRVTDLGSGNYRYDFAVMNLDFARGVTQNSEPNLRVVSNNGFRRFTVPIVDATSSISQLTYADGDTARADWTAAVAPGSITWTAPADAASLNWGTMTRFSFVANRAPSSAQATLDVTDPGSPASFAVDSFGVGVVVTPVDVLFMNGFE